MTTTQTPRTGVTPSQSRSRQNMAIIGNAWRNLPRPAQNDWFLLGQQIKSAGKKQKYLSAFQCFSQLNGLRLSYGLDLLLQAPDAPDMPGGLPPTLVNAHLSGTALTLTIQPAGYSGTIQCWGAPPVLAGQNSFHSSAFKLLGTVPVLSGGPVSVAALFQARYKSVVSGDKIALKLYAVSDSGFRGPGLVVTSVALGLSASVSGDNDVRRAA